MRTGSRWFNSRALFFPDALDGAPPKPDDKPADGGAPPPKPDDKPADKPDDKAAPSTLLGGADDLPADDVGGKKPDEKPASGAPEKYELKLPENSALPESIIDEIATHGRELGLSNEAAQKTLELLNSAIAKREASYSESIKPGGAEWIRNTTAWQEQSLADPEIGGNLDNLKKSASVAKKALKDVFEPAVAEFLEATGMGSHPAVIKGLVKIARMTSEGKQPPKNPKPDEKEKKPIAERMYGKNSSPPGEKQ